MNYCTNFITTYYPLILTAIIFIYYAISSILTIATILDNLSVYETITQTMALIIAAALFGWLIFPFLLLHWALNLLKK